MSNELTTQNQQPSPFGTGRELSAHLNVGAVEIESQRAIAEAQGQLVLAKRFPRSMAAAMTDFMDACASPDFAATAFYAVPNRGSGPSIRFAEEAARCYGNFEFGHREFSRSEGRSEIEVYAWDKEKNNRSSRQITVVHVTDTKNGPKKLTDQADIDNKIANVASKQMRGRILALLPKGLVAAGIAKAKLTIGGGSEKPMSERIAAMAVAFGKFGVTQDHLVAHLGHAVDNTTIDELADLQGIYNAIKEGAKASEYFGLEKEQGEAASAATAAAIAQTAAAGAAAAKKASGKAPPAAKEPPPPAANANAPAPAVAPAAQPKGDGKPAQNASNPAKDEAAAGTDDGTSKDARQDSSDQVNKSSGTPEDDVF